MLETMRPNPLAKPAPASLPAIKRAPARPWDPKRYKPESKVTPAQHAEFERTSDKVLPTSESLGQQLKAQGYYEKAPGGYQGAMDRAQQAAANDPIANAPIYTQKAIEQEFPVLWGRTNYKPGGSVSRQPWRGKYPNGYVNMLVKAQEPYRPLDPGATVPRDTLTQSILEHELTHTAQGNDPGYKPKQNIPLQTGRDPWHAGDQWMNWVEVDPRLAEIKRYYTRSHPGSSVDTPEDAAKAWDWFKSEGYKIHPNPLLKQLDLPIWKTLPKDPAALKKLLLRRMPQLMQNRDPNTFGKTSMLAGTQLAGKLKQASLGYAVRDSDIHGQGTFATRAYEPGDRVGLALQSVLANAELTGSRGRARKYGRPEPEGRDHDYVVFSDDADEQAKYLKLLRQLGTAGYKLHDRPGGFLTASGNNTDLSVYPTSKRDDIHKAWELIEGK